MREDDFGILPLRIRKLENNACFLLGALAIPFKESIHSAKEINGCAWPIFRMGIDVFPAFDVLPSIRDELGKIEGRFDLALGRNPELF